MHLIDVLPGAFRGSTKAAGQSEFLSPRSRSELNRRGRLEITENRTVRKQFGSTRCHFTFRTRRFVKASIGLVHLSTRVCTTTAAFCFVLPTQSPSWTTYSVLDLPQDCPLQRACISTYPSPEDLNIFRNERTVVEDEIATFKLALIPFIRTRNSIGPNIVPRYVSIVAVCCFSGDSVVSVATVVDNTIVSTMKISTRKI